MSEEQNVDIVEAGENVDSVDHVDNVETVEKVIDLDNSVPKASVPDVQNPEIKAKTVKDLTDEERQIIINNAKAGIDTPNFEVRFFKNGNSRIVKKKAKPLTVTQKVLQSQPVNETKTDKVCLSNDQLLMEHIIELNSKFDKLYTKHKKLKKKYYNLRDDIYVDDNEIESPTDIEPQRSEPQQEQPEPESPKHVYTPPPRIGNNWRSRVQFLY